jgi:hypothetical protein
MAKGKQMSVEYIEEKFSYNEASIIILTLNMYCNGPPFYHVDKKLTCVTMDILDNIMERFYNLKETIRKSHPNLYILKPYTTKALETTGKILFDKSELALVVRAFEITLEEAKWDNYYEIEIHTSTSVTNVFHCFEHLNNLLQGCR